MSPRADWGCPVADLGSRNDSMRLQCHRCGWPLPDDMKIEAALLHMQVEHDTDEVKLELVAVCSCGEAMTVTESQPTGGGVKDYLSCGVCGNTGHLRREPDPWPDRGAAEAGP
jgi:hypothetical protein